MEFNGQESDEFHSWEGVAMVPQKLMLMMIGRCLAIFFAKIRNHEEAPVE